MAALRAMNGQRLSQAALTCLHEIGERKSLKAGGIPKACMFRGFPR